MIKLKINKIDNEEISVTMYGSGKLATLNDSGKPVVQGLPKIGKEVKLKLGVDYYLTENTVKFLEQAIHEYNAYRGESRN